MRVALLVVLSLSVALAATVQQLPVPEVLSTQVEKVTKVITQDGAACAAQIADLQHEINKRELIITKFEKSITTVRTTFQLNQQQLQAELKAIQEVNTLVKSVASGLSSANLTASTTASLQTLKSDKMATVLQNIVESVSLTNSTAGITLDFTEVLSLINELENNIKSSISTETVTAEEKTYNEKIEVEKGTITALKNKLATTKTECARRKTEFTEVLAVLKLIEQQYENVTIPDCRPALAEKDKATQQCNTEKTVLESTLTKTQTELKQCQDGHPATPTQCTAELATCKAEQTKMTETMKGVDKCASELKTANDQVTTLTTTVTKLTSEKVAIESSLTETRSELEKQTHNAKCQDHQLRIQQLETRIHELSIKVELGEKCAANYKAQTFEKEEMVKQLEKLTTISSQLEKCEFNSAKDRKECTDSRTQVVTDNQKTVETLNKHITELNKEVSRLEEAAKCTSEHSVIEKYEKEIVTIKTETKTVVTQVESEYKGCEAELSSLKKSSTVEEVKISEYFNKVQELTQQVQTLKTEHSSCVESHTATKNSCKTVADELAKCKAELATEIQLSEKEHSLKIKLDAEVTALKAAVTKLYSEEQSLKHEVATLTTKITTEETKIVTLTTELKEHETNEQKLLSTKTTLETTVNTKTSQLTTVEKKVETIEIQLKGEEAGNQKLIDELKKLHGEREALNNGKIQAETDLKKAIERLSTLREFKKAALSHLVEARDIIDRSDKKIDELTSRITTISSRRSDLSLTLTSCDSRIKVSTDAIDELKKELSTCNAHNAALASHLDEEQEASKCLAQKATITELKKHGYSLRVEIKAVTAVKSMLVQKVSSLEAKLSAWQQLNHKLQDDIRTCSEGHVGCRTSVRSLKNQLLSNLRKIKTHVTSISRLEERLASSQVELKHTRAQWNSDRTAYKTFKDNLLEQMSKLIALAKDAKRKFDVARHAARNELKVQDAQWGVCRKEVLNYERILGTGVVKAEKEKIKNHFATKKYIAVKSHSEAALAKATANNGSSTATREASKAHEITVQKMEQMIKNVENKDANIVSHPAPKVNHK